MPTWLAAQETIPYEQLAPGVIVFSRHGTIHVIDIDTHSRWSRGIGIDPQVSPDGSRIVFYAWHSPSGALNVIGTREGSPLLVNTFGGLYAWTPDLQSVTLWDASSGLASLGRIAISSTARWEDVAGGLLIRARFPPFMSPTGGFLLWYSNPERFTGLLLMYLYCRDNCGPNNIRIWEQPLDPSETLGSAVWSPDFQEVAYSLTRRGEYESSSGTSSLETEIVIVNPDGSAPRTIAVVEGRTSSFSFVLASLAWSPDGSQIAFVASTGEISQIGRANSDIFAVNIDGTGLVQVTSSPEANDRSVSWGASLLTDSR